jgi:hypothetical protein
MTKITRLISSLDATPEELYKTLTARGYTLIERGERSGGRKFWIYDRPDIRHTGHTAYDTPDIRIEAEPAFDDDARMHLTLIFYREYPAYYEV